MRTRHPDCYTFPGSQAHWEEGEKKDQEIKGDSNRARRNWGRGIVSVLVRKKQQMVCKSDVKSGHQCFPVALDLFYFHLFFHFIIIPYKLCD